MKYLRETGMLSVFLFLSTAVLSMGLKGGPVFTPTPSPTAKPTPIMVAGTYAGSLLPKAAVNTVGFFTLVIPTRGLSQGPIYLIAGGETFTGTIEGLENPNGKVVTGSISVDQVASGMFTAKVKRSTTTTTLNGSAVLGFDPAFQLSPTVKYTLTGFKQF